MGGSWVKIPETSLYLFATFCENIIIWKYEIQNKTQAELWNIKMALAAWELASPLSLKPSN